MQRGGLRDFPGATGENPLLSAPVPVNRGRTGAFSDRDVEHGLHGPVAWDGVVSLRGGGLCDMVDSVADPRSSR